MSVDSGLADTRSSYDTITVNYANRVRDSLPEFPYLGRRRPEKVATWLQNTGSLVETRFLLSKPDGVYG
ncbi:hypothetical protein [Actinoplanes sichuanensis]|uniref:Uncharacterized protein n=1 Tax=Actinoplanes sichuanensis TaxID=512349 RepID=A0ABW4A2W4_9ACTN|nr:hypothetical protein [Actinoplanes sichuanensis]